MLRDIVRRLRGREIQSVDLVASAYRQADGPEGSHVFTRRYTVDAQKAAEAADRTEYSDTTPAFLGVPVTVKDNFDLAGVPTTAGSILLRNAQPAAMDADVVKRLKAAGFVVLGRTNMTEFAFSGLGLNPHYGTPRNPAFPHEERIPGGSSSGAAVSVGLGIAPAAIGTDTGGSIRIPAALCGLVGFKPTAAAISQRGVLPLSTTLDSVGVIARSVACCAAVLRAIADMPAAFESRPITANGAHLAVIENYVFDGIEDHVARSFEKAIRRLEQSGTRITRITLRALNDIPAMHAKGTFAGADAYAWHRGYVDTARTAYDPRVLARIVAAAAMTPADYEALKQARAQFITRISTDTQDFDGLLAPTVPVIAPKISTLADDTQYHTTNALMLRNPTAVNLMDGCAVSMPCHDPGEPPVGLSLIGLGGRDGAILSLAQTIASTISPSPI